MKVEAANAAKWSRHIALWTLAGALAGCGGGYGGGGSGNAAPTASLMVNPMTVTLGQSATLNWSSAAGASCDASGAWRGAEPASGTAEVTPTETGMVTYTLTCSGGTYSGSATSSVTLTVEPASAYMATSLVEDSAGGGAVTTDAHLVNPWGIAFGPTTVAGVANNHSESATLYDGNGLQSTLSIQFPTSADTTSFEPTGIVFNDAAVPPFSSADFLVTGVDADHTGPAAFILAGEGGMIAGWLPGVDSVPITVYTAQDGAVYKGLTLANNGSGNFLYATDFANGKIDVFDASFAKQDATATRFAFNDPTLPEGYAPFGIQAIDSGVGDATRIYVSYAKRDPDEPDDDAPGPGLGIVDAFDTNGNLLEHVVAEGGKLNSPWGMALAPADFGTLSNALLVGNFGDGTIHGYDPSTGRYLGAVTDATGTPFVVPGLWGIAFGNDALNQPHATLFFAAGTNDEADGLFGRLDLGEAVPALGTPPVVTLTAPEGDLSGTVTLTANVEDTLAITQVQFVVNERTLIGTTTGTPSTVQWDTTTVSDGNVTLRAIATDDNGNVGSSAILLVSVANNSP
jgi:uncharacterized protein (TIGR03118 family)